MEGFLNKNDKGQGGMGIFALSSSSPCTEKQGREGVAHAGGGPGPAAWGSGAALE